MAGRSNVVLTGNRLSYVWRELAQRMMTTSNHHGIENTGISLYYDRPENVDDQAKSIIIVPCMEPAWEALIHLAPNKLEWRETDTIAPPGTLLPFGPAVPVLLWGGDFETVMRPFVVRESDNKVVFYCDILASIFFMLTRFEESVSQERDQHDRFPAQASVAYKQNFLDIPIVDQYAIILRSWMKYLNPAWVYEPRRFSVRLSHDIDRVSYFSGTGEALKTLGGDLIKRRSPSRAYHTARRILHDPYFNGIARIARLSEAYGMHSIFYFMSADRERYDNGYDISSRKVRKVISDLQNRGHEIGLHPGYKTYRDFGLLDRQKSRLENILKHGRFGSRQHVLQFDVPDTWRILEKAGLIHDSSMAYADHEGFRCGTCHPFHPYDVDQDREVNLLELPLIVMEFTLLHYRQLSPAQGEIRTIELAERCRQVEGDFTFLWHNSSFEDFEDWVGIYQSILDWSRKITDEECSNPKADA